MEKALQLQTPEPMFRAHSDAILKAAQEPAQRAAK
jgi:hypothetical protein